MELTLRNCTIEDAPLLHRELGCNEEMLRYTGWNPYGTLESAKEFLVNALENKADYSWIMELDHKPVGMIGAYDYNAETGSIEIGYSVFRDYWGKGYASGAVALSCATLAANPAIRLITAWSAPDNIASTKALLHNGFVQTEIHESAINVNGATYNQVIFEKHL